MSETLKFSVVVRKWLYRVNRLKFFLSGRSLFSAEQYWAMILCGDTAASIKKTEFSLKCHTLSRVLAPTTNRNMSRLALVSDSVLLIWTRTGFTDMKSSNRCCSWSPCWPPATLKRRPKTPKRSKTLKVVNWKGAAFSAATDSATAATATASGVLSTAVMEDMVDMACTDTVAKWLTCVVQRVSFGRILRTANNQEFHQTHVMAFGDHLDWYVPLNTYFEGMSSDLCVWRWLNLIRFYINS